jgi:hypothetical protein
MFIKRRKYIRMKRAALKLQTKFRGRLAKLFVMIRIRERILQAEIKYSAVYIIQRNWRAHVGRCKAQAIRDHIALVYRSAVRLQFAWYQYKENFSTFVLMRALWEKDEWDKSVRAIYICAYVNLCMNTYNETNY